MQEIKRENKQQSIKKESKTIVFLLNRMLVGGIPRATIALMKELVKRASVTLILSDVSSELMSEIPEGVDVIYKSDDSMAVVLKRMAKNGRVFGCIKTSLRHIWYTKIRKNWIKACENIAHARGLIVDKEFDIAIVAHGMNISQMVRVLYGISAKKKIAWVHGSHPFENKEKGWAEKVYCKFDQVIAVSDATRAIYTNDFSAVANKCITMHNILDVNRVKEKGGEFAVPFSPNHINLVSVGRLSEEKGYDMVPRVTKILIDKGYPVRFYIIGDGPLTPKLKEEISKTKTEESVFLLGTKTNPYPYMKACDIYVQPSYEEGYSTTICEAGVLGCAIVGTTTSGGIREQVEDGVSALIAEPTPESIAQAVERYINDKDLYDFIKTNILMQDFSNSVEINKLFGEKL